MDNLSMTMCTFKKLSMKKENEQQAFKQCMHVWTLQNRHECLKIHTKKQHSVDNPTMGSFGPNQPPIRQWNWVELSLTGLGISLIGADFVVKQWFLDQDPIMCSGTLMIPHPTSSNWKTTLIPFLVLMTAGHRPQNLTTISINSLSDF